MLELSELSSQGQILIILVLVMGLPFLSLGPYSALSRGCENA